MVEIYRKGTQKNKDFRLMDHTSHILTQPNEESLREHGIHTVDKCKPRKPWIVKAMQKQEPFLILSFKNEAAVCIFNF